MESCRIGTVYALNRGHIRDGYLSLAASRVGKVADEFFALGIHTDDGQARLPKEMVHPPDVAELTVPVGMARTGQTLAIRQQPKVQFAQQPSHGGAADGMGLFLEDSGDACATGGHDSG